MVTDPAKLPPDCHVLCRVRALPAELWVDYMGIPCSFHGLVGGGTRHPTTLRAPGEGLVCHSMTSLDPVCSFSGPGPADLADLVQMAPPAAAAASGWSGEPGTQGAGAPLLSPSLITQHLGRMDGGGSRGGGADRWLKPDHSEWMGGVGGNPVWRVVWSSGAIEHRGPRGEVLLSSAMKPPWTQAGWFAGAGLRPSSAMLDYAEKLLPHGMQH
eukprot:CAMPEP_0180140122 /NCGR_PEP_ID=MMETSP0986-20121125/14011_1 /TAXON_ID=697907 /ORGANISM="non described non described, Strain CCMP2293" /LENGTH=212 /DNA_ID=CAMNT_0022082497 /DNA_START=78 /DNA_END=717 /DNA_ORIENTATION=-